MISEMRKTTIEIIEKLEIIRAHRQEEQGLLSKLMDDELLVAIDKLSKLLAKYYLSEKKH